MLGLARKFKGVLKEKKKVDLEREEVFVHLKQKLSTLFSFWSKG